jgi:anti-anti-sigma factor
VTWGMFFETEQRDDICIVRISGRLASGADSDYLRIKAQEIKSLGCRKLIADICELVSVGSAGIGFFVDLHTSMTKNGGRFVLAGPSPRVLEVLALTGLSTIIPMAADLPAALAFCAREGDNAKHAQSSAD